MKNFVETFQDSIDMTDGSTTIWELDFKRIQLDAMREGMRRAAEMCVAKRGAKMWFELERDILSSAEQLTEKDL